jgi:EmrB/QacA subfamily drug resistance transporter
MSTTMNHPRRWVILALVLAAECMDLLDGTVVNVAAPTIRTQLHTSAAGLQWIIGGYALAFAIGLLTGARLGDIYGRKRIFVLGALGFVAASAACGLAVNADMLIACRLAQGAAAALLIPQGLGIIRSVFAAEDLNSAFAFFGPVIGLSSMLGPIIGGALIDANAFGSSWRLIFFVNLPLGLLAALGAARLMPESAAPRPPQLDLVGTLLAALAMGLLIYPLIQGQSRGWPLWTYAMIVGSVVTFGLLVVWIKTAPAAGRDPLVVASVFTHRAYVAGLGSILVFFAGMIGTLLVLTLYLQFGEHFTAIHAGLTLAPFAVGSAVGATLAATVLVPRFGRTVLQVGAVVLAGGIWWLRDVIASHGLATSSFALAAPQVVLGLGIGMLISPLFGFILASVTDDEVGSASGVLNACQQLAGATGVAILGTIFFATLGHAGFVAAVNRCLLIELCTMPVLVVLTGMLPRRARQDEFVPDHEEARPAAVSPAAPADEPVLAAAPRD